MNHKLKLFIAGYCSGISLVLAGHPFDTIKVRLQSEGKGGRFQGPLHCLRATIAQEGLLALYKGATPPLLATGCINSLLFTSQALLVARLAADPSRPTVSDAMRAAVLSGFFISLFVTPMEGIKARLQVQYTSLSSSSSSSSSNRTHLGPIACAKEVLRTQGVAHGLYRGWACTAFCRMSNWSYFGAQAFVSQRLRGAFPDAPAYATSILSGGAAGIAYWLSCFPVDVVKNRMQTRAPAEQGYATVRDTARTIWRAEGWTGFFRGFLPCMLRAIPANAAAFTGFEAALRFLPASKP